MALNMGDEQNKKKEYFRNTYLYRINIIQNTQYK